MFAKTKNWLVPQAVGGKVFLFTATWLIITHIYPCRNLNNITFHSSDHVAVIRLFTR
jgi:hypothetical protein